MLELVQQSPLLPSTSCQDLSSIVSAALIRVTMTNEPLKIKFLILGPYSLFSIYVSLYFGHINQCVNKSKSHCKNIPMKLTAKFRQRFTP